MIAILHIHLPFPLLLPDGEEYNIKSYVDRGYKIQIYSPGIDSLQSTNNDVEISINGKSAFQAHGLKIVFMKDEFDRRKEVECDPPFDLIQKTLTSFLSRLRFVTRSTQIMPVRFRKSTWDIIYRNDDGTELKKTKGLVNMRAGRKFRYSWTAVTPQIWEDVFSLPVDFEVPEWDNFYLNSLAALPDIGMSLVLAMTSLEVFIANLLDKLAQDKEIPKQLWDWINNREWLKEPSLDEKFDGLLKILLDVTLKDKKTLWETYKNLKNARNSFVHEGIAKVNKKPVTLTVATELVTRTKDIIKFIQSRLPASMQVSEYQHKVDLEFTQRIL